MLPIPNLLLKSKITSLPSASLGPCRSYTYNHPLPPFYGGVSFTQCNDGVEVNVVVTQGNSYTFCAISGSAYSTPPFVGSITDNGVC